MKRFAYLFVACGALAAGWNLLRTMADVSKGTNAHINLSSWNHYINGLSNDDVRHLLIVGPRLPASIDRSQLSAMRESLAKEGRYLPEFPHFDDPWGQSISFTLLSVTPTPQWRIESRVGRSFWGRWASAVIESKLPNQALEPTATSVTIPAFAGLAPAVAVAHL